MKFLIMGLIKFYRKFVSPLFPPRCAVRGSALSVWRILRCNPWSMGGIDYVPEKFTFRTRKYDFTDENAGSESDGDKMNQEV